MSIITKHEIKPVKVVIENYEVCDKCGKRIERDVPFDAFNSSFIYETGDSFPEGRFTESQQLDLCQDCGIIAMNLLKENGFKFYEVND